MTGGSLTTEWINSLAPDVAKHGARVVDGMLTDIGETPEPLRAMVITSTVAAAVLMLIEASDNPVRTAAMLRGIITHGLDRVAGVGRTRH